MAKGIAFFPWWFTDQTLEIGRVRILPYSRKKLPGDLPGATQRDIDDVLSAYATAPKHVVKNAALLEVDDWKTGDDPDSVVMRLFRAKESLAFAEILRNSRCD